MDKVPEEVKQIKMFLKHCHGFLLQVKEKAKAEKRQKKAIATGRNAAAELKVGVGFKSRYIFSLKTNICGDIRICFRVWESLKNLSLVTCSSLWIGAPGQIKKVNTKHLYRGAE